MAHWFQHTVLSGSMVLAIPVAMIAGLVSFFSPCVVPLLPGYLAYVTGLSGADLESARRGRMLLGALGFVLGFSVVFVLIGSASGALGQWLFEYQHTIKIVLGAMTIAVGIVFMGALPLLQRDWRVHKLPGVGLAAAPLIGVLFGLGWTPCLGPTLAAVSALAVNSATVGRGMSLSLFYCLGLGLPFIAAALAYRRTLGAIKVIRRHQQWVTRLGGVMLIVVGVLLITGWWDVLVEDLRGWFFPGFTAGV